MIKFTKTFKIIFILALIIIIGAGVFYVGYFLGNKQNTVFDSSSVLLNKEIITNANNQNVDFSTFWKAWKILDEKFIGTATSSEKRKEDTQNRVWGAIAGMTASLSDPFTVFFPPEANSLFEEEISGSFEGVGMEIGMKDKILTVIAPLKDTPAEKAGILPGDKIAEIEGENSLNMIPELAVKLIRGPKDTPVNLTIFREGADEPIKISIIRGTIQIPTIDTKIKTIKLAGKNGSNNSQNLIDGVFIISLYNFSQPSPMLFQEKLREFIKSGSDKLILDLRGNPGGYLGAAIDMASWFLPLGKIVVKENYGGKQPEVIHRSRGYNIFNDKLKMVILVDKGSASASEILAGALQEHNIAKLVGTKTFGKGSVQELIKITPETSIKVTVAKWLTPKGRSISDGGLTPDVYVERTIKDRESSKDPQMDKAIEELKNM